MKFARIIELGEIDQVLIQKRYTDEDDMYDIIISVEQNGLMYDLTIPNIPEEKANDMFNNLTLDEIFAMTKKIGLKIKK